MKILNLILKTLKKYWQDFSLFLENPRENTSEILVLFGIFLAFLLLVVSLGGLVFAITRRLRQK